LKNRALKFSNILAFVAIVFTMVLSLAIQIVNADSNISIYLVPQKDTVGQGDIIKINVYADNMPGVTKFGPIEVKFDDSKAEFVSVDMGSDLSRFVYTTTQNNGSVIVSAVDQVAESDKEDETAESPVFNSQNDVILFTIYVRVKPDVKETIPFRIENVGSFTDQNNSKINVIAGSGVDISIKEGVSNDATITFLRLNGVSISPDFNKNITQYTAAVDRSVTDIPVSVTPSNLWAAVVINGNQNLQLGDNLITIDVTAQDSVTHVHYEILVTRKESYVPDNLSIVDNKGVTYTFVDLPAELDLPEGFMQGSKVINGYSVPAFSKDGLSSVILYLFDGTNTPAFYVYNQNLKTVVPYTPDRTIIQYSEVLVINQIVEEDIPAGFKSATVEGDGITYNGYENEEGDFICYLTDEAGNSAFYLLDKSDNAFYRYKIADKRAEQLYNFLFYVFFAIATIEAIILVVVIYIVRKIILDKTNPRPRRL